MPVETRIQLRRDTAANWTSVNPVLSSAEVGVESDTLRMKVGNGSSAWNALPYSAAGTATSATTATNIAGGAAGSIPFQTSANTTSLLAAGAANRVLIMNGSGTAPVWGQPKLDVFAATTSAELRNTITDNTGTGALVFASSPSLTTPVIGSAGANFAGSTSGSTNVRASATASGTLTFPAETGTVATREWTTSNMVTRSGDTMTGNLAMGSNNISGVNALTATTATVTTGVISNLRVGASGYLNGNGTGSNVSASATIPVGDLSGTLPVGSGGTGRTTLTAGNYLTGNGSSAINSVSSIPFSDISDRGNANFDAGSLRNWGSLSTNTKIFVQSATPSSNLTDGDLWFYG
jgi:hypothetical protein